MEICFELSDRYHEEIGPWPLERGSTARVLLYAFRDHSPAQHGGRLLLPDLAIAPAGTSFTLRRLSPATTAFCGLVAALRTRRLEGKEWRDETTIRIECGAPVALIMQTRRWDNVDAAPLLAPPGVQPWQIARPVRVADVVSGTFELQEAAFEVGGVSSFPLLDTGAPDHPVQGRVTLLERLHLDPSTDTFGTLGPIERVPDGAFWPHRYFVTLAL